MKRFILAILLCLAASSVMTAQSPVSMNIDTDLWSIRNNAIPGFSMHYDDYLQYAPAAAMLGIKAFGYESRSSWGRMLVSDAFSVATMAIVVNGLKYSIGRLRPDGSRHNSFPSGHTATAFMTAAMLDMEYGWRSPWFSIGGYTLAAVTGVSRVLNNRHWMSDVVAGAAIGVGSVHLGYWLSSLIFKKKGIYKGYMEPEYLIDPDHRYYSGEIYVARRFILNRGGQDIPERGAVSGLQADIPLFPRWGVTARAAAGSLTDKDMDSFNMYNFMAGGYWNLSFGKYFDVSARILGGYARHHMSNGFDFTAGASFGVYTDNNFRLEAIAEYETFRFSNAVPYLHSIVIGFSSGFVF